MCQKYYHKIFAEHYQGHLVQHQEKSCKDYLSITAVYRFYDYWNQICINPKKPLVDILCYLELIINIINMFEPITTFIIM